MYITPMLANHTFTYSHIHSPNHTFIIIFLQDDEAQEQLRLAAEHLRAVVNAAASSPLKKKVIKKLEMAAKQAAAVSTQLIAAAQGAGSSNRSGNIFSIFSSRG